MKAVVESHCGRFCTSLPASGATYIHQTQMSCYSSALADAASMPYIYSGLVNTGSSKAAYKGYSKGSGCLSLTFRVVDEAFSAKRIFLCEVCSALSLALKN